mmetsp:Transcript_13237/g.1188  ORF Transcript_13237/g.1188 Transcript_13237/m.1188 type:complete len:81 (+) Transcript_13237:514-756(+)
MFVISYLFMVILRYCTAVVIWTMLFSIVSCLGGFGVKCFLDEEMKLFGIVLMSLGALTCGAILFLYKKIKLTIAITRASA